MRQTIKIDSILYEVAIPTDEILYRYYSIDKVSTDKYIPVNEVFFLLCYSLGCLITQVDLLL